MRRSGTVFLLAALFASVSAFMRAPSVEATEPCTPPAYTIIDSVSGTGTAIFPGGAAPGDASVYSGMDTSWLLAYEKVDSNGTHPHTINAGDLLCSVTYADGEQMSSETGYDPGVAVVNGTAVGAYETNTFTCNNPYVQYGCVHASVRQGAPGQPWGTPYLGVGADPSPGDQTDGSVEVSIRGIGTHVYAIYSGHPINGPQGQWSVHARQLGAPGQPFPSPYYVVAKCVPNSGGENGNCTGDGPGGSHNKRTSCSSDGTSNGVICVWNSYNDGTDPTNTSRHVWGIFGTIDASGNISFGSNQPANITGPLSSTYGACVDQYNPYVLKAFISVLVYFTCDKPSGGSKVGVVKWNGSTWGAFDDGAKYKTGFFTLPTGVVAATRLVVVSDSTQGFNRLVMMGSWPAGGVYTLAAWDATCAPSTC
jgi:hypothetical protein